MIRQLLLLILFIVSTYAFIALGPKRMMNNKNQLSMSTILVFGGTGQTGREIVYQALQGGDKVVSLSRSGPPLLIPPGSGGSQGDTPLDNPNLIVEKGSVTEASDVAKVFAAATDNIDGVIIALGGKTSDVGKTMLTDGTNLIVDEMIKNNIKRVAIVTSIGAGDSENQAPFMFKVLMKTVMSNIFVDKNNQEDIFINGKGKDLDYCIVRPGGLGTGAPTGIINVIDGEAGSIQRADVAAFCLGAITEKDFEYIKKTPCISSVGGTSWVKQKGKDFDSVTK